MFSAATLKHGLLTVYGSEGADVITLSDGNAPSVKSMVVAVDGQSFTFPRSGITRIRVFGFGGFDTISLNDVRLPNVTDVMIDGGGGDLVTDSTRAHTYNRGETVSIVGGAGDDTLTGGARAAYVDGGAGDDVLYGGATLNGGDGNDRLFGDPAHSVSLVGGAGDDTLSGGAAGATLDGGDGNDLVSASYVFPVVWGQGGGPFPVLSAGIGHALLGDTAGGDAGGAVALVGGAGDDVLIGNRLKVAGVSDTLTGGDGSDELFAFGTDLITDFTNGVDTTPAANQFTPPAAVTQTATLRLGVTPPAQGVGNNGPNNRIAVTDANGTITMQGPPGSQFLLSDLLDAAGYPVDRLGIPPGTTLVVNGSPSTLSGDQIAGYQINDGDVIDLEFNF